MLSRNLKRVLLDSRWPLPPTFLLPWAANLTTTTHTSTTTTLPPPIPQRTPPTTPSSPPAHPIHPASSSTTPPPTALPPPHATSSPPALSPTVRTLLPLLKAQAPHYITLHIHGKPYLLTAGDTIRLPFLMHNVEPGDILRLNRALNIGSRDYTLKAAAAAEKLQSPKIDARDPNGPSMAVIGPARGGEKEGVWDALGRVEDVREKVEMTKAPHFIPHIEKGKHGYLDERLYVCRAVVMGVESEPLRIKEKTKRRNRKVKKVRSKLRFTVLRVKEVRVRDVEELEGEVE